jgi:hypothetical protein
VGGIAADIGAEEGDGDLEAIAAADGAGAGLLVGA